MKKRVLAAILVLTVFLLAVSCSKGPSREKIKAAISENLQSSAIIPQDWAGKKPGDYPGLVSVTQVESIEIGEIEESDQKGRYMAKARVVATVKVNAAIYGTYIRKLNRDIWFQLYPETTFSGKSTGRWNAVIDHPRTNQD